jgi:hypothetical protein
MKIQSWYWAGLRRHGSLALAASPDALASPSAQLAQQSTLSKACSNAGLDPATRADLLAALDAGTATIATK